MKKLFKINVCMFVLLAMVFTNLYFFHSQDVQAATAIKLNKSSASILKGKTLQLSLIGAKKNIIWKSSNTSIATVSKNGVVTAKQKGSTIITCIYNKKNYSCKVVVSDTISLLDLVPIAFSDMYVLFFNEREQKIVDNMGQTYDKGISFSPDEGFVQYVTKNNYSTLEGTFIVNEEHKNSPLKYVYTIMDENENVLFESKPIELAMQPQSFSVDISNVDTIKISMHRISEWDGRTIFGYYDIYSSIVNPVLKLK